ncbi:MAG: DUF6907 domain-containing protein [Nocardioides sp.]
MPTTTTTTPLPSKHPREAICPPWCDGHDGEGYLPWEMTGRRDDVPRRSHAYYFPDVVPDEDAAVGMCAEEFVDGMREFHVTLCVDVRELTPDQADAMAAHLVEAARRVRAFEVEATS